MSERLFNVELPSGDEIRAVRHTKAQLAAWGIPWPPPSGWKRALELRAARRRPTLDTSPSTEPFRVRTRLPFAATITGSDGSIRATVIDAALPNKRPCSRVDTFPPPPARGLNGAPAEYIWASAGFLCAASPDWLALDGRARAGSLPALRLGAATTTRTPFHCNDPSLRAISSSCSRTTARGGEAHMRPNEAEAIIRAFMSERDIRYGDWDAMEELLDELTERDAVRFARALARVWTWQTRVDPANFLQPSDALAGAVAETREEVISE